ncbi:MAG: His/Gly/Thr/Pro-type tRNA ligase C-terminal domain-containing protein, partial [Alteraurantiacibacter sp.]
ELRAALAGQSALDEPLRVLLDLRPGKAAAKRWDWVRKGAPVIVEVGSRDMANGVVSVLRRDALWDEATGKPAFQNPAKDVAGRTIPTVLAEIQTALFMEAQERRDANIARDIYDMNALAKHFANGGKYPGWVEVQWSTPTGTALEKVIEQLKAHKLTFRNVPLHAPPADGTCIFTGEPAVERIYVARAY